MQEDYINITLADDDEDDRLFFTDAFDEIKITTRVKTFNDGVYLMDYLNSEDATLPNVLFLDLNMPRKSGLECLKEIKQNPKFKDIAIAIYSTSASEEDIENTFVQGANIYIKKPSDFKTLKKVLSEVVTINWQYHTNSMNKDNFLLRF
ncbi:MAG: CheY-like chemotaxis protein [Olleya marilimosa]|jgi:CheY-like chemotaxis protein|uniref:Response regulator n=1 Tax=Olleya marilimosa TaxID=272164 RepID=A0ABR8LW16_9FLAO|nr:response regulator [Olleya marilimosa]MBD3863304.1 response regulator [Olleya marilimosa]MBD3890781.1 response regulator [Olleya marilimosa]PIB33428.1 transcriptional regulator [Gaetbulibacter sp. 5U11]|tara:strand:+ start:79806 stop:80252 length:447 start_codon:yes stop_codon:yes gene_type:complete